MGELQRSPICAYPGRDLRYDHAPHVRDLDKPGLLSHHQKDGIGSCPTRLQHYDKLFLVLPKHLIAGPRVEIEVEAAVEKERKTGLTVLFPIKVDQTIHDMTTGWAADTRRLPHMGILRSVMMTTLIKVPLSMSFGI